MTMTTATDEAFEEFLAAHADERLESYKELVRIPSISALPEHVPDCRRAAEWIAADLERIGMEHVEVAETGGHPVVYADWLHADGAPTVLVYCHYDVQPVDPLELWTSPPFEPVVVGDRILGRGVADDKGQLHLHLRATEALLATRGGLPVNLRFVFEGEEESSSVNLDRWLAANRDRLGADFALISDTGFFEGNLPSITIALRGMMYAQIDVTGTEVDLHSGGYGGAVENPANALARIIAGLKDERGRIQIPGFYDDVLELTDDDRRRIAELPFDEDAYLDRLGLPALHGEVG
jgi:acetylornithine deacetylase/succinyl-diaminopimelate desuccinylase-like protein